jgi:hypothetical protein
MNSLMNATSYLDSDFVRVIIGPSQQGITAHRLNLMKSKFFRTALSQGFCEGTDNAITLPEDDVVPVRAYNDWLYISRIPEQAEKSCAQRYAFGYKICDEEYCNAIMDDYVLFDRARN